MKAQLIKENIEFKRGKEAKEALKIGAASNPIKLLDLEEEFDEDLGYLRGLSKEALDLVDFNRTYHKSIDKEEAHHILLNWEREADGYLGAWVEDEEGSFNQMLAGDLEGNYVEYYGELYWLPITGIFNNLDESIEFKNNKR